MKKITFLLAVTILSVGVFAQNDKYTSAMKKNIAMIDSAFAKPDAFLSLANTFERIGTAEKNQWVPYYYAAYCRVNYAFMEKDKTANDPIADKAAELIAKADSLQPNNSEISCVKSMIASVKMMVNPQQRFMQYGAESDKALKIAMIQDTTNPRPYLLKGQSLKYMPEQYGGGCKTAKPKLEMAKEKFAAFKSASPINPDWGREYAERLLKDCQ